MSSTLAARASNLVASCYYSSNGLQPNSDGLHLYISSFLLLVRMSSVSNRTLEATRQDEPDTKGMCLLASNACVGLLDFVIVTEKYKTNSLSIPHSFS